MSFSPVQAMELTLAGKCWLFLETPRGKAGKVQSGDGSRRVFSFIPLQYVYLVPLGGAAGDSLSLKMAQALFSGSRASRDIPHMLLRILMLRFCLGVSSGGTLPVPRGVLDVLLCHPVCAKP